MVYSYLKILNTMKQKYLMHLTVDKFIPLCKGILEEPIT